MTPDPHVRSRFGRYALSEDETIISLLETVLACSPILRAAVIPSLRGFVAGEFKDYDVLILGAFQNLLTTMNGKKRGRVFLKIGWGHFLVPGSQESPNSERCSRGWLGCTGTLSSDRTGPSSQFLGCGTRA